MKFKGLNQLLKNMFKITQENRDALMQYLAGSRLPYVEVAPILQMLSGLEKIELGVQLGAKLSKGVETKLVDKKPE